MAFLGVLVVLHRHADEGDNPNNEDPCLGHLRGKKLGGSQSMTAPLTLRDHAGPWGAGFARGFLGVMTGAYPTSAAPLRAKPAVVAVFARVTGSSPNASCSE